VSIFFLFINHKEKWNGTTPAPTTRTTATTTPIPDTSHFFKSKFQNHAFIF